MVTIILHLILLNLSRIYIFEIIDTENVYKNKTILNQDLLTCKVLERSWRTR